MLAFAFFFCSSIIVAFCQSRLHYDFSARARSRLQFYTYKAYYDAMASAAKHYGEAAIKAAARVARAWHIDDLWHTMAIKTNKMNDSNL